MKNRQHGLSLVWCAVVVGIVALVAMLGLLSMRYDRNLFAESWKKLTASAPAVPAAAAKPTATAIHKCSVNGVITYSNVECKAGSKVELSDTRGVEAPKAPPAPVPQSSAPTLHDKMIDRATERAAGR